MGQDVGAGLSQRRIATVVIVIGGHLCLFMLMLKPATQRYDFIGMDPGQIRPLQLRFVEIRIPRPHRSEPVASRIASPSKRSVQTVVRTRSAPLPVSHEDAPPSVAPPLPSYTDGGFARQLHDAQQGQTVHGLPGSDLQRTPGIQLTDPRDQGIGAIARKTQRLFGVPDSHCVEVDRLRTLTPEELSARHLSLRDLAHMNDRYACNRPLGLSF